MTSHLMSKAFFRSTFILYFCFCLSASNALYKDFTTTNSQSRPKRWFSANHLENTDEPLDSSRINCSKNRNDKRHASRKTSIADDDDHRSSFNDAPTSLKIQPTSKPPRAWLFPISTTTRQPVAPLRTFSRVFSNGSSSSQESSSDSSKSISSNDIIRREQTTKKPVANSINTKNAERPSEKFCRRFERDCELKSNSTNLWNRIAGGKAVKPKTRTFMVLIGYGTQENREWQCGGSLLNERYVLSAAHCTAANTMGKPKWARVGELDYSENDDDARPQEREIVETIVHPNYDASLHYDDIALFKLDSSVTFNNWVTPICLTTAEAPSNIAAIISGWGRTDLASSVSPMLLEAQINIFNRSECLRVADDPLDSKLPRGIDTDSMICAGDLRGGKDACSGDSGGPLFIEMNSCLTTQIGITSFGKYCGVPNYVGVYTNVYKYISWIESIVWVTP